MQLNRQHIQRDDAISPYNLLGSSEALFLNQLLFRKSSNDRSDSSSSLPSAVIQYDSSSLSTPSIRLFCGTYSTAKQHETQIEAIRTTWGSRCSSYLAFSTLSNATIPSIAIPHLWEESYHNM